ncbi:uncharacterized protein PV06_04033 [Exophiala oligosperma]|uniref:Uncharacterized protein n=1 Tax=Exophiala oligosperma TaxID=215243 RepID=A0A0D2B0N7_9EURO|nr:uncharacterized protein PV06_04033 [Exophiala oligosperma]KIW45661.1 hypothetical protein PV06_04033 [Exophiala oligosperma]
MYPVRSTGSGRDMSPRGSHHHQHGFHMPSTKQDARPSNSSQIAPLYLLILAVGGIVLVTKPILIVLAILIVGYGRLYHVQPAKKSRMPWSQHESPGYVIRAGPQQGTASHDWERNLLQGRQWMVHGREQKTRLSI